MRRKIIINRLSEELAEKLGRENDIETIKQFITAAIVTEMERNNVGVQLYQQIDPNSGAIIDEFWGLEEAVKSVSNGNLAAGKSLICMATSGERHTAYGFCWKKAS